MVGRSRARLFGVTAILTVAALMAHPAHAADEQAGTFGASFLNIPIGAKLMAVPDVVAAMQPDASLTFSNPAAVSQLSHGELFLTTSSWLDDLSLSAASIVLPIGQNGLNLALGTRLLYSGGINGFSSATNQVVEEESFYDVAFNANVSKELGAVTLGGGATYVREHLAAQNGSAVTFSAGATYKMRGHRVDVFAQDVGGEMSYPGGAYPINYKLVAGYGYSFSRAWGRLDLGGQFVSSRSDYRGLRIGGAYQMNRLLTLRTGYNQDLQSPETTNMPISAGFGIRYSGLAFDYAYNAQEYFSNTHTVSVAFSFGQQAARSETGSANSTEPRTETSRNEPAPQTSAAPILVTPATQVTPAPAPETKPAKASYLVIGGIHGRMASAEAEARALRLLRVPAQAQAYDSRFRVIVGTYDSKEKADKAAAKYAERGHRFTVVSTGS